MWGWKITRFFTIVFDDATNTFLQTTIPIKNTLRRRVIWKPTKSQLFQFPSSCCCYFIRLHIRFSWFIYPFVRKRNSLLTTEQKNKSENSCVEWNIKWMRWRFFFRIFLYFLRGWKCSFHRLSWDLEGCEGSKGTGRNFPSDDISKVI